MHSALADRDAFGNSPSERDALTHCNRYVHPNPVGFSYSHSISNEHSLAELRDANALR